MQPIRLKVFGQLIFSTAILLFVVSAQAGGTSSPSSETVKLGKQVYNRCIGCHSMDRNRTGPKHCGILGRKAASVENYDYSKALENSDIIWTRETLNEYIKSPFDAVPGTTMGFSGIKDDNQRAVLIDYLITANATQECPD